MQLASEGEHFFFFRINQMSHTAYFVVPSTLGTCMFSFLSRLTQSICSISKSLSPPPSPPPQPSQGDESDVLSVFLTGPKSASGCKVDFPQKTKKERPRGQADPLRITGVEKGTSMVEIERICRRFGRVSL